MKRLEMWRAEKGRHLMIDDLSIKARDVTRRYLEGKATIEELEEFLRLIECYKNGIEYKS